MNINKVWTPSGYQAGPVNSLVGKGESIIDYTNGTGTLVTKGKRGVDNQPSSVQEGDQNVIAGNDIDYTNGMKFSDQAAPLTAKLQMYNQLEKKANVKNPNMSSLSKRTAQLQMDQINKAKQPILDQLKSITDRQQQQHDMEQYNCGKNRYATGKESFNSFVYGSQGKTPALWPLAGNMIGLGTSAARAAYWAANKPSYSDSYVRNPYAASSIRDMESYRESPYAAVQAANLANRATGYQIANSGAYTGGQRQSARVASGIGQQRTNAGIYATTEANNVNHMLKAAEYKGQLGAQEAQNRMAALVRDRDRYDKAHGAQIKGFETHLANTARFAQQYWADRIKNKQYEDTLGIYQQDVNNRNAALKSLYGGNDSTPVTNTKKQPTQTSGRKFTNPNLTFMDKNYNMPNRIWKPGTSLFGNKQDYIEEAARQAIKENQRLIQWGKNREAIDRLRYGDNGSGYLYEHINPMNFRYMTNPLWWNSLTPYERWAGQDVDQFGRIMPLSSNGVTFETV